MNNQTNAVGTDKRVGRAKLCSNRLDTVDLWPTLMFGKDAIKAASPGEKRRSELVTKRTNFASFALWTSED